MTSETRTRHRTEFIYSFYSFENAAACWTKVDAKQRTRRRHNGTDRITEHRGSEALTVNTPPHNYTESYNRISFNHGYWLIVVSKIFYSIWYENTTLSFVRIVLGFEFRDAMRVIGGKNEKQYWTLTHEM